MPTDVFPFADPAEMHDALVVILRRIRATHLVTDPGYDGPSVLRVTDRENDLDAVMILGDACDARCTRPLLDAIEGASYGLFSSLSRGPSHDREWRR